MCCLAPILTVLLALPVSPSSELRVLSQSGVTVAWEGVALGETDADGLMVIEGIPPGEYRLSLSKLGFHPLDVAISMAESSRSTRELLLDPVGSVGTRSRSDKLIAAGKIREGGGSDGSTDRRVERVEKAVERVDSSFSPTAEKDSEGSASAPAPATAAGAGGGGDPAPGSPLSEEKVGEGDLGTAVAPEARRLTEAVPTAPSTLFLGVMILLLTLLAGAAGARFLSGSRAFEPPAARPRPGRDGGIEEEDIPVFDEDADRGSPSFLEDLKRRERCHGERFEYCSFMLV